MKNISIIRKVAALVLATTTVVSLSAQDLTSYFMEGSLQRNAHNAAFAPDRGYFTLPLVGNTSFSTSGNTSLGQLLFKTDDSLVTIFDTSVSADAALSGLNAINSLGFSNTLSIIGFGGYSKNKQNFRSLDINLRTSMSVDAPYELFEFIKEAPEQSSIRDLNFSIESYAEVALGYSRPIGDRLVVGGRVKLLAGLANISLNIDKMDVTLSADEWMADATGSLDLNASGVSIETSTNDEGDEIYDLSDITMDLSSTAGMGMALDLGATYKLLDNLTLSLAANDIGFIKWKSENNTSASVSNNFSFSGASLSVNSDGDVEELDSVNFDDLEFVAEESKGTTKWLQGNINAGAEYSLLGDKLSVGAIYSIRMWNYGTEHAITTAATFRPLRWISLAASYEMSNNQANAVGLAANVTLLGFLNLYAATNVLNSTMTPQYIPIDQTAVSMSFGLSFAFGKGERNL